MFESQALFAKRKTPGRPNDAESGLHHDLPGIVYLSLDSPLNVQTRASTTITISTHPFSFNLSRRVAHQRLCYL